MATRYFLIGETGDDGAWLVDIETKTVERIDAETLESGANIPDSTIIANLNELRTDRSFTIVHGVNLAIAASSLEAPSGHIRRESGSE